MGWSVVPAIMPGESGGNQADLKEYSQVNKLSQPDFYQKEAYKQAHEDEDMLPGQKMYYQERQGQLNQAEQSVRGEMYDYFSKSQNIPSATMQQTWNKKLYGIEQQRMKLTSEASLFRQNYVQAKGLENKLVEGGDKSSANRIALTYDNGTYLPMLGEKEEGGYGWLTHLEAVKGFDLAPGESPSGRPVHAGLSTSINYTGDFDKFLDDGLKSASQSKDVIPQAGGALQTVSPLFGTENMQYMTVITQSSNADKVVSAAKNLMENMPEPARLDLTSKFYEKLLHAYQKPDGTIAFAMDNELHEQGFNEQESSVAAKLLNMQKLDRKDKEIVDGMVKKYGQNLILSQVPKRVDTTSTLRDIKVMDKGTGEGTAATGGFTEVATGKAQPSGTANITWKSDGILKTELPAIFNTKGGQIQLNRWEVPPRDVKDFTNTATTLMRESGGIMPDYFSKGFGYFYSEDGVPNSMALLQQYGARIVGITGSIQENFPPSPKQGAKGTFTMDVPDIKELGKLPLPEVERMKMPTVQVIMAVPEGSNFFDDYTVSKGLDFKQGVREKDYPKREYYDEYSGGKNKKVSYTLVPVWVPIKSKEDLMKFEGEKYSKGTQKAEESLNQARQQNEENYTSQLRNTGLLK